MRLALLTDLHANREALTACLEHAEQQGADQYAFLGDLVGYGGDPAWVVDTVMAYVARGAVAVQGNHDHTIASVARPKMHPETLATIEWTRGQMSPAHVEFLGQLPLTRQLDGMLFVHASAEDPIRWEYIKQPEHAERSLRATASKVVFSGHVHTPSLYRRTADGRMGTHQPQDGTRIVLDPEHQYLAIPGAVGQPRDGNNAACYALYDDASRELSYFRVPYDHGAAARRVIGVGLPMIFAMRLVEGI